MTSGSTAFEDTVKRMASKAAVVHIAMTMAVVIYAVVTFVMQQQWDQQGPPQTEPPPAIAFLAVAAASAGIALWMRSRLPPADGVKIQEWEKSIDQACGQDTALGAKVRSMTGEERTLAGFVTYCTIKLILVWAMAESVAIVGMARAFLSRNGQELIPFLAVSLALLLATTPRLTERLAEARRLMLGGGGR
ncbi:MAG TPA: hypothetical protein VEL28_01275 [Candidatus Binatia bacterium]|nr:hypothetical protein [Candidatus Binatia bacterium]